MTSSTTLSCNDGIVQTKDGIIKDHIYLAAVDTWVTNARDKKFMLALERMASGNWRMVEVEQERQVVSDSMSHRETNIKVKEPVIQVGEKYIVRWSKAKGGFFFNCGRANAGGDRYQILKEYSPDETYTESWYC